jgi:hypothetical protein
MVKLADYAEVVATHVEPADVVAHDEENVGFPTTHSCQFNEPDPLRCRPTEYGRRVLQIGRTRILSAAGNASEFSRLKPTREPACAVQVGRNGKLSFRGRCVGLENG